MDSQNKVARICMMTATTGGILSAIGWFVIGMSSKSMTITIAGWVGTFLGCLMLYALGEIINQLTIANMDKLASIRSTSSVIDNRPEVHKKIESEIYLLYSKKKLPIDYKAPIEQQREEVHRIIQEKISEL